jgi:hypothetical protein
MSVHELWVERLFARLQVRYGNRWTRMWEGINPEAIKADWEETLGALYMRHPEALAYGLEYLPENPPTSGQFKAICLRAPDNTPRLEAPRSNLNREFMADIRRQLEEGARERNKMTPAAYCAMRLRAKIDRGEKLNAAQRAMLASCETMLTPAEAR